MNHISSRLFWVLFLVWLKLISSQAFAQSDSNSVPNQPLEIGDLVPNFHFKYVNTDSEMKRGYLSDYAGKLVILDFWATTCMSCVQSFYKLDSLQRKYKDKLQVILVGSGYGKNNFEKDALVLRLLEKWENRNKRQLTVPNDARDTLVNTLFPHSSIPHLVWIGIDRRVKAITYVEDLTEENIQLALQDKLVGLRVKQDSVNHNVERPLFISGNGADGSTLLYHSLVSRYTERLQGNTIFFSLESNPHLFYKIYAPNTSIPEFAQAMKEVRSE